MLASLGNPWKEQALLAYNLQTQWGLTYVYDFSLPEDTTIHLGAGHTVSMVLL